MTFVFWETLNWFVRSVERSDRAECRQRTFVNNQIYNRRRYVGQENISVISDYLHGFLRRGGGPGIAAEQLRVMCRPGTSLCPGPPPPR